MNPNQPEEKSEEIVRPNNKPVMFKEGEIVEIKTLRFIVTKVLRNRLVLKLIH